MIEGGCSVSAWEYRTEKGADSVDLNALGREGWELVGVPVAGEGVLIFKRPSLSFREQVTLDQKRRYYAEWGIKMGEDDVGAQG
jgi:hypothetical protein